MNFGHLRTFVAIVDAGGVHRAAARLNLSQPAVSRQIHALESDLGLTLFDRIGRRVQLTSEGEDLLRRTRRLLAEAESLSERAGALKKGETGILRVGGTPQVIESMLADFLNRFREIYPGVEVQLVEEGGTNLPGLLERGHILLALMAVDDERFDYRLVYPVHGLAVVGKNAQVRPSPGARCRGARGRAAGVAARRFCFARLVRGGVQRGAFPAARAVGDRRPAHRDCAGCIGLWDSARALHGSNAARTRPCRGVAAAWSRGRTLDADRLGSAALARALREAVRR